MVKVNLAGQEVSMDGFLKAKLDNIKKIVNRNFDCVILIDGTERIGKSTLGITVGTYLDPKFSTKNISANSEECIEKIENLPDKSILMIDEGSLVLGSKDAMRQEQKKLIKILNVVGQKNMIFIVVLPSFFELNRYIATSRARFLLHCYSDLKLHRGRFGYFGTNKLRKLYEHGKKNYGSYRYPKTDFIGKFQDYKPSWYEGYLEIKKKSLMSALKENENKKKGIIKEDILREYLVNFKKFTPEITNEQLALGFGIAKRSLYRHLAIVREGESEK